MNQNSLLISLRQPVQKTLSRGEIHSYYIQLNAGYYCHTLVNQSGIGVKLSVQGPEGQKIVELNGREIGSTPVSLIAETSGNYRLEVRSLDKEEVSGTYEVKIEEIKPATAEDKSRIAGERAFAEAEYLRAESKVALYQQAIKKYEIAISSWQTAGEKREEANTLKNIGEVNYQLGKPQIASEYYDRALRLSRELNDIRLESEILSNISFVYQHLGKNQEAMNYCVRALKLSQNGKYQREEALALYNIGEIYYAFGDRQQSFDYLKQALSLRRGLNDRRGQAQTLLHLGHIHSDQGETKKAFDHYYQALHLWWAVNHQQGQTQTLISIAHLHSKLGEKQEALNLYNQAMPIIQTVGDRIWQGSILHGIAYVYKSLGDIDQALGYYNEALRIFQDTGALEHEAGTLVLIGRAYFSVGDNHKALNYFQQALSAGRTLADKKSVSLATRYVGAVYASMGNNGKALFYYNKALSLYRASTFRRGEADTLNDIGNVYLKLGSKGKALDYFERALSLNRTTGDRFAEASTIYNIARVELDRGNLTKARSHVDTAFDIAESLRANVVSYELRVAYFASIQRYFEFYIRLLMLQHRRHPSRGFDANALKVSERARARSLLELLAEAQADIHRGADPALIEHERELGKQIHAKAERKLQLLNAKAPEGEVVAIAKEIRNLTNKLDQVKAEIRAKSPSYAALTQPQPASLKEIQQLLDDNTLLLEYALGGERSYLWAVTRTEMKSYELPGRAAIEKAAQRVRDLLISRQPAPGQTEEQRQAQYWRQASALSRMLLKPVAGQLGAKRLLIVADGALQHIPFGALPAPESGRERERESGRAGDNPQSASLQFGRNPQSPTPLIVEHEIVNLPSASTLAVLRRETEKRTPAPKAVAVLADPVFDEDDRRVLEAKGLIKGATQQQVAANRSSQTAGVRGLTRGGKNLTRLYYTRREAEAIGRVVPAAGSLFALGFDANRDRATSDELRHYRIIHFATHGILDRENPELSTVVFSLVDRQGRPQDGYLRLHDVYNLNLPAELVVLSACDSALGKEIKGEGLVGLTRGFMYAGAARVMASLWNVDDEATAVLMEQFYRRMLNDRMSPAAALREAQVALWRQPQWRAPYYWAAFVMQGEWK